LDIFVAYIIYVDFILIKEQFDIGTESLSLNK